VSDNLDRLADAVAERLLPKLAAEIADLLERQPQLVDAATRAGILGVSRAYVYEHAAELGAEPLGNGAKPRLRFDVDRARVAFQRGPAPAEPHRLPRQRNGGHTPAPLLPIHRPEVT
jgi:hypothetical protein